MIGTQSCYGFVLWQAQVGSFSFAYLVVQTLVPCCHVVLIQAAYDARKSNLSIKRVNDVQR